MALPHPQHINAVPHAKPLLRKAFRGGARRRVTRGRLEQLLGSPAVLGQAFRPVALRPHLSVGLPLSTLRQSVATSDFLRQTPTPIVPGSLGGPAYRTCIIGPSAACSSGACEGRRAPRRRAGTTGCRYCGSADYDRSGRRAGGATPCRGPDHCIILPILRDGARESGLSRVSRTNDNATHRHSSNLR